jgi:hypothetical protein
MDINKTYANPKLERRRQKLIQTQRAIVALKSSKYRSLDPRVEVSEALRGRDVGALSRAIMRELQITSRKHRQRLEPAMRLLPAVASGSSLLDRWDYSYSLPAIVALIRRRDAWIRDPEHWEARSYNKQRQLSSLLRHLLASYHVPRLFDATWLRPSPVQQEWFIHIGRGQNLRTAPNLPIALTKKMAHHVLEAPDDLDVLQALRFGQALGHGVSLAHLRQVVASQIGRQFVADQEPFWESVLRYFAQHPMIDPDQIGPIIDYLRHQKFEPWLMVGQDGGGIQRPPAQPGLSMQRRDPVTLVRQVEAWHRQLARVRIPSYGVAYDVAWRSCGIAGYDRVEGDGSSRRHVRITELLSSAQLRAEGDAMRHCVATYTGSCHSGRTAIYSLTVEQRAGKERLLTIEVSVQDRRITQARGRMNQMPTPLAERVLRAWATTTSVRFGHGVLGR